jgi:hypothetical protein
MKHSPGPWGVHGSHIYAPDGAIIAQVHNPGSKEQDYPLVANRNLMGAAPKMLAALEEAAKFIRHEYEGLDPATGGYLHKAAEPIWAVLSEAIAEARSGESDTQ